MKIVVAPDKFKGCLSAAEVAQAIATGLGRAAPDAHLDLCPLADGGEGTVEAMVSATGGRIIHRMVTGPLPTQRVSGTIGLLGDGQTAIIEMASASGLALLKPSERNPMRTTTYGTGELLRAAAAMGVRRIILGIGGSATVDGGLGAAQAWGFRFVLNNGSVYGPRARRLTGGDLSSIAGFSGPRSRRRNGPEFVVACDVSNPLCGPNGAAAVFAPQKGATPRQVRELDAGLRRLAAGTQKLDVADAAGAGAAGGLGFAMVAFFQARVRSGVEIVMDATDLPRRLAGADLCITGEGRLDTQSLSGKVCVGVARACRTAGIPCVAIAGSIGPDMDAARGEGLAAWFSLCDGPIPLEQAVARAPELLAQTAENILRVRLLGRP